jgi:hypothetical protein
LPSGWEFSGVFLLWPFSAYDRSQVHPSIRNLHQPYRSVIASYYLDGGSVGVDITDRDGQQVQCAVPVHDGLDDKRKHHRLFLGGTHIDLTNTFEVVFTSDTKRCLADIIDRFATPGSDRDLALIALRGNPHDYAMVFTGALLRKVSAQ